MGFYSPQKNYLAVHALDLFAKIFCIKDGIDDLEFECAECPFQNDDRSCDVKKFKARYCPDYKDFGSMGDL